MIQRLKTLFKKALINLTPERVKNIFTYNQSLEQTFSNVYYSQDGEDILLDRLLNKNEKGFYIDIGAHHPVRFSNTYLFYQKGWNGINIEPNPEIIRVFNEIRPRDINQNVGVSQENGILEYYMFNEPALNTFAEEVMKNRVERTDYEFIGKKKIQTRRLKDILDEYSDTFEEIDFLSVDTEGFDLLVLQSNDWATYRPNYVVAEELDGLLAGDDNDLSISQFMESQDYYLKTRTTRSLIFKDGKSK